MDRIDLHSGCSGFSYKSWKNIFYPENITQKNWLAYYASHFNTVEINNTFYGIPTEKTVSAWKENTPENFRFSLKANRYLTHLKKLTPDAGFRDRYLEMLRLCTLLGTKMGCLLWQLPANFHLDLDRLKQFSELIATDGLQHTIEFRHPSWYCPEVYAILEKSGVNICRLSCPLMLPDDIPETADFTYMRFHGRTTWYDYEYSVEELSHAVRMLHRLEVKTFYVYFNNDVHAHSVKNGLQFRELFYS